MSKQSQRKFSAGFKARVALEALKEQRTLSELSHQFEVHPVTISKWKSEFLENLSAAFNRETRPSKEKDSKDLDKLYVQIGQLKVENDFLKKKCQETGNTRQRMEMISPGHKTISLRRQCDMLSIPRSSLYYQPIAEKPENVKMMHII